MPKFVSTKGFKWIDPKEFDLNKYTRKSSKRFLLEVDLKYLKELGESKREMLSKDSDIYNISTDNVKKLVLDFILGLKLKKNTSRIRIQSV